MYTYGLINTKQEASPVNLGVIFFDYDGGEFEVRIKEAAVEPLLIQNPRISEELNQLKECLTELWSSANGYGEFRDSLRGYIDDEKSTIGKYVTLKSFPYFDASNNSRDYSGVIIRGKNYFEQYLKCLDYRAALFFCETYVGDETIQSNSITIYPIYSIIDRGDERGKKVCNGFIVLENGKLRIISSGSYRCYGAMACDLEDGAYLKIECFIKCVAVVCGRVVEEAVSRLRHNQSITGNKLATLNISEFRNMECLYQGKESIDLHIGESVDMAECVKNSITLYNGFARVIDDAIRTYFHYRTEPNK